MALWRHFGSEVLKERVECPRRSRPRVSAPSGAGRPRGRGCAEPVFEFERRAPCVNEISKNVSQRPRSVRNRGALGNCQTVRSNAPITEYLYSIKQEFCKGKKQSWVTLAFSFEPRRSLLRSVSKQQNRASTPLALARGAVHGKKRFSLMKRGTPKPGDNRSYDFKSQSNNRLWELLIGGLVGTRDANAALLCFRDNYL